MSTSSSMEQVSRTYEELLAENQEMRFQLDEATDMIQAIRSGQIDALVVQGATGAELYSLKTADHTYRIFIEKMNEGAVSVDEAGTILYCNSRFADMMGLSLSDVLGCAFDHFISDDCKPEYYQLLSDGWKAEAKKELALISHSRQIECLISATAIGLDKGATLSMLVTDLSFQKKVEELLRSKNLELSDSNAALERSNLDLLQFASVASHDLQEPLRKIMMFSGLLKEKLGKSGNISETTFLIDKMASSSERMKMMIADILAYSRLTGKGVKTERVNLRKIIEEIMEDFEVLIEEKAAAIEIGDLPALISADRGQMRQVFQNLISNALKFSLPDRPPHIKIAGREEPAERKVIITVSDDGIGFDVQYRERIFSLFQRLNTKDEYEGSGIGLAVARKIMEKHQGSITASSSEGAGSTFTITLPQ